MSSATADMVEASFLGIPPELRNLIYKLLLDHGTIGIGVIAPGKLPLVRWIESKSSPPLTEAKKVSGSCILNTGLVRVNKQIATEATKLFYGSNTFKLVPSLRSVGTSWVNAYWTVREFKHAIGERPATLLRNVMYDMGSLVPLYKDGVKLDECDVLDELADLQSIHAHWHLKAWTVLSSFGRRREDLRYIEVMMDPGRPQEGTKSAIRRVGELVTAAGEYRAQDGLHGIEGELRTFLAAYELEAAGGCEEQRELYPWEENLLALAVGCGSPTSIYQQSLARR
ncbi:hypothetical protein LTR56_026941 [Elasticomyces elasticus]|nr:hypothetical protein LTR56_026941 [Elasticomyces elasticus]KAK4904695.1 hypothetical protein LTR49_025898 [Elasticomyces elasticus]